MKKIKYLLPLLVFNLSIVSCIQEDETPITLPLKTGSLMTLDDVAGPKQPHQVWIDISSGSIKTTHREDWDLGFYNGDQFRVVLNSSLMMAVGKIENTINIDAVNSQTVAALKPLVHVGNFTDNSKYIDHPDGNITFQTSGISAISPVDEMNPVYLLNMGFKTSAETNLVAGGVYTIGEERGWKKIRILQHPNGYKIQYADLDEATHKEFIITKDAEFNYQFFSILKNNYANIQPKKDSWDICYTVFTNLTTNPSNNLPTSYIYPDFVTHNILGGVGVYEVTTAVGQGNSEYNNFKISDVESSKFVTTDQRTIGSNWRTTTGANGAEVFKNKFYILKNSKGIYYKLIFQRLKNNDGMRGYPQFEYQPL
ncbi:MAG: HmuY family protein [Chryseobacterium sp.]|nr:HmuY family protein [Candidatus Chryseobacterium enterohippi]